jgi:hypothetical protein
MYVHNFVGKPKNKHHFGDVYVEVGITLKLILKKQGVVMLTGSYFKIWAR